MFFCNNFQHIVLSLQGIDYSGRRLCLWNLCMRYKPNLKKFPPHISMVLTWKPSKFKWLSVTVKRYKVYCIPLLYYQTISGFSEFSHRSIECFLRLRLWLRSCQGQLVVILDQRADTQLHLWFKMFVYFKFYYVHTVFPHMINRKAATDHSYHKQTH